MILPKNIFKNALKIASVSALLTSCGVDQGPISSLKFRPADSSANNQFLIAGAQSNLAGVPKDVRDMESMLGGFGDDYAWKTQSNSKSSRRYILDNAEKMGAAAGENGTVGVYLSGHGSASGHFQTQDGREVTLKEIATAIAKRRTSPLKRLVVYNDSCFSGQWVNGNQTLGLQGYNYNSDPISWPNLTDAENNQMVKQASTAMLSDIGLATRANNSIQEYFVMSAAQKNVTSLDAGAWIGGIGTSEFIKAYKSLYSSKRENATLGDLVNQSVRGTLAASRNHHKPQAKSFPESLMTEKLFGKSSGSVSIDTSKVYLSLGEASDTEQAMIAAAPANITKLAFCYESKAECLSSSKINVEFKAETIQNLTGRKKFSTTVAIQNGSEATLIGFDAAGAAVTHQRLQFKTND